MQVYYIEIVIQGIYYCVLILVYIYIGMLLNRSLLLLYFMLFFEEMQISISFVVYYDSDFIFNIEFLIVGSFCYVKFFSRELEVGNKLFGYRLLLVLNFLIKGL